ncbi:putative holliday junction resolvase [Cyclonatronum proteinivorum]|uniref:Putative pre-16S rRNA nuclease n=1 Tax=Cyclonatronum proteinivorum TaxID=1457365 RepID=A0A345UMY2_9BACT|nr:Holliday junction resolvase RuvX [Cyclonatronum proteinivorum]AXJ01834.1 putative holliday junction resolvase [Cyclonatronum proteinivorum]
MGNFSRILAFDVGHKRTGLAQSDPMHIIASPIGAFGEGELFEKVAAIIAAGPVSHFVVGWPIGQQGQRGASTQRVEQFVKKLNKRFPGIEVTLVDERFTSVMAKQQMIDSGMKKKKRQQKGIVDATAACIILQEFLDQNSNTR